MKNKKIKNVIEGLEQIQDMLQSLIDDLSEDEFEDANSEIDIDDSSDNKYEAEVKYLNEVDPEIFNDPIRLLKWIEDNKNETKAGNI